MAKLKEGKEKTSKRPIGKGNLLEKFYLQLRDSLDSPKG